MDRSSGESRLAGGADSADRPAELVSRCRELETVAVETLLEDDAESRVQWAAPDGPEIVGRGVAARFTADGTDRFDRIRAQACRAFDGLDHDGPEPARPRAVGGFSFHDGHEAGPPWTGFDAAAFVVPQALVTRTDDGTWVTTVGSEVDEVEDRLERWSDRLTAPPATRTNDATPGVAATRRTTSPVEWTEQVNAALERIADGRLTKVVLAQALAVDLEGPVDVPATLERLARRYPNCYRFLIGHDVGGTFCGAPP